MRAGKGRSGDLKYGKARGRFQGVKQQKSTTPLKEINRKPHRNREINGNKSSLGRAFNFPLAQ